MRLGDAAPTDDTDTYLSHVCLSIRVKEYGGDVVDVAPTLLWRN
jgi:hypothetical protein